MQDMTNMYTSLDGLSEKFLAVRIYCNCLTHLFFVKIIKKEMVYYCLFGAFLVISKAFL